MNNTTKAKYDMAEKMLKVDISLEEVALMTELPVETLKKIQHDIEKDGLVTRHDVRMLISVQVISSDHLLSLYACIAQ